MRHPYATKEEIDTFFKNPKDISSIYQKKIRLELREKVAEALPDKTHIAHDYIVRYRLGKNPKSLKHLKTGEEGFQPGKSGFEGRKHTDIGSLRAFYRAELEEEVTDPRDGRTKMKLGELLPKLHIEVLLRSFKNKSDEKFNRLLAELRSNVGEPAEVKQEITKHQTLKEDELEEISEPFLTRYLESMKGKSQISERPN